MKWQPCGLRIGAKPQGCRRREAMRKVVVLVVALLFVGAIVAPVIAQAQAPAAKGTEGPDIRKAEPEKKQ